MPITDIILKDKNYIYTNRTVIQIKLSLHIVLLRFNKVYFNLSHMKFAQWSFITSFRYSR